MSVTRGLPVLLVLALLAGCGGEKKEPGAGAALDALDAGALQRLVAAFNRGVGHMDRYEAKLAIPDFEEVVALAPDWSVGHLNLGIALLNAEEQKLYPRAEEELRRTMAMAPDDPRAYYALGMLLTHLAREDEAIRLFGRVLELDPDDPDTHYQLGALLVERDPEAARRHLETAVAAMPHHEAAVYRLFHLLHLAGEEERASALLARFQRLKEAEAGTPSSITYGEMGRYADVARDLPPPTAPGTGGGALLEAVDPVPGLEASGTAGWPLRGDATPGPGIALADVDGDGDLDLFVGSPAAGAPGTLHRFAEGRFRADPDAGLDATDVVGATFGDMDGDGDQDVFLTRRGPDRLYRNEGDGRFTDVTEAAGVAGPDALGLGAAWGDLDHDGDLDLFVARAARRGADGTWAAGAPNELYRNDGDGTFTAMAQAAGVDGGDAVSTSVLLLDADDDRDLDLYVIQDGGPNRLWLNARVGDWVEADVGAFGLADDGPGLGALLADLDGDGDEDVVLVRGEAPPRLFRRVGRTRYEADADFAAAVGPRGAVNAVAGDLDLDGLVDLVLLGRGAGEVEAMRGRGPLGPGAPEPVATGTTPEAVRGAVLADLDDDGALDLVVARAAGAALRFRARPPADRHWLVVRPGRARNEGEFTPDPTAVGLHVEVQTGRETRVATVTSLSGYLGGTPARVHLGLGGAPKADHVRLTWPDAVLQGELEVPADRRWDAAKVERKPSSCPILFAWDGEAFRFVTDFLGVGGVGFFVEPGVYAPPDPTEDVRIPPELLRPRDGRWLLRVAEPLEEVTYLDALHLRVYDHPADQEVYPDERFAAEAPFPTGEPYAVREKVFPRAATDDRGRDVLDRLLAVDRRDVEPPVDPRFTGYARDHHLELDFRGRVPTVPEGHRLVLFLHGWVEYTYSHVNYAAWQAGVTMRSPSLLVPDGDGGWRVARRDMGFPAGLPRMMTVDVTDVGLEHDGRLRIASNMDISWDQAFLGVDVADEHMVRHRLDPVQADLRFLGYPREYSPDGRLPTLYDYERIDPGLPYKILSGDYTRLGDVRPLLAEADDHTVIFGRGEELVLAFDATTLPPLPEGWTRTVVLHAEGWCKDMDLYTAFPDTVGPLPFRAMGTYPPDRPPPEDEAWTRWQATWNTRHVEERPVR